MKKFKIPSSPRRVVFMSSDSIDAKRNFEKNWPFLQNSEALDCFICKSNEFMSICEFDRYGFIYPVGMCHNCGNIQQTRYYSDESLSDFYSNYYRTIYGGKAPSDIFDSQFNERGPKISNFINLEDYSGTKILEIGCASGGILSYFHSLGAHVMGIDFDDEFLEYGRQRGLNLLRGGIDILDKDIYKFDLIFLNHVLEHILDPGLYLQNIKHYLKPGGKIFIAVPSIDLENNNSYGKNLITYFQNAHIIHFHKKNFESFIQANRFKINKIDESIQAIISPNHEDDINPVINKSDILAESQRIIYNLSRRSNSIFIVLSNFVRRLIFYIYDLSITFKLNGFLDVLFRLVKKM